jgi:hypothetical protein
MVDQLCDILGTALSQSKSGLGILIQRDPPIEKPTRNVVNHTTVNRIDIGHDEGDTSKEQEEGDMLMNRHGDKLMSIYRGYRFCWAALFTISTAAIVISAYHDPCAGSLCSIFWLDYYDTPDLFLGCVFSFRAFWFWLMRWIRMYMQYDAQAIGLIG